MAQPRHTHLAKSPGVEPFGAPLDARPGDTYWTASRRYKITRLLEEYGWTRVDQDAARLVWGRVPRNVDWSRVQPGQLVDCVRGSRVLTNKENLTLLLRRTRLADRLQPETWLINNPVEWERFLMQARDEPHAVWIKKPTNLARGIGVEVVPDAEAFRQEWESLDEDHRAQQPSLLQRYIQNPLLVDGRKSEIRVFFLIASTDPLMVLSQEEAVRLACRPFELGSWADPLIHLENTSRAKKVDPELFERMYPRLKWPLKELGRDLVSRGLTDDPNWINTTLRPSLRAILQDVLRAAQAGFERRPGSFQLIGMDCMLTDDLSQLWLTEFQRAPGLAMKHPIKERLVPAMLAETLEIVMEIQDRRRAGADLSRLDSPREFQWVINDAAEPTPPHRARGWLRSTVLTTRR